MVLSEALDHNVFLNCFISDFQRYSVPEDLIPLSCMALSGLACFPHRRPDLDEEKMEELPYLSPVEMPECPGVNSVVVDF